MFIGYANDQKGRKCYHPPSRKVFVSMDVTFREDKTYFKISEVSLKGEDAFEKEETTLPWNLLLTVTLPDNEPTIVDMSSLLSMSLLMFERNHETRVLVRLSTRRKR